MRSLPRWTGPLRVKFDKFLPWSIYKLYNGTGFLIALKGFVAAIIGGLASYPVAALGALIVGLLEAFASFWASAYKEVIVFSAILPVLLWRSLRDPHGEDH